LRRNAGMLDVTDDLVYHALLPWLLLPLSVCP